VERGVVTARTRAGLAVYVRVSTDKQAEEGNGLEIQEKLCRQWAKAHSYRVVQVFTDAGVSGAKYAADRPGLTEALACLESGDASGLIVRDLDRLAREVTVQEAVLARIWTKNGHSVFTASGEVLRDDPDDPMRTAMRQMVGVFSGLERRMVVKRMRDGRKAKAAKGGHSVGAAPYGWTAQHGELTPHPEEQMALSRMQELSSAGLTTREVAEVLRHEGRPTKRGGNWSGPVVARILSRTRTDGN
jgi:DNA invertase Pin-like site-specific DNA recombinase